MDNVRELYTIRAEFAFQAEHGPEDTRSLARHFYASAQKDITMAIREHAPWRWRYTRSISSESPLAGAKEGAEQ